MTRKNIKDWIDSLENKVSKNYFYSIFKNDKLFKAIEIGGFENKLSKKGFNVNKLIFEYSLYSNNIELFEKYLNKSTTYDLTSTLYENRFLISRFNEEMLYLTLTNITKNGKYNIFFKECLNNIDTKKLFNIILYKNFKVPNLKLNIKKFKNMLKDEKHKDWITLYFLNNENIEDIVSPKTLSLVNKNIKDIYNNHNDKVKFYLIKMLKNSITFKKYNNKNELDISI